MRILIIGNDGGTNVGGSFLRAAHRLGYEAELLASREAMAAPWIMRQVWWRALGRRPPRLGWFSARTVEAMSRLQPQVFLATGMAPVAAGVVREANRGGVKTIDYLTDDPFGSAHRANWFLSALPHYRVVASPRRANLAELTALGCGTVRYLPFGYDADLHYPVAVSPDMACDVLFVGGYEAGRVPYLKALVEGRLHVRIHGDWRWRAHARLRRAYRGGAGLDELRRATCSAKVNVVLGRRQNRDGHTMRTFEVLACGAVLLAEDTDEHRELLGSILGPESFFSSPQELVQKARYLAEHPERAAEQAARGREWARDGTHQYEDRLRQLLATTAAAPSARLTSGE
jgi:spore maturation protein CgeB